MMDTALAMATDVRAGRRSARAVAVETLDRIAAQGGLHAATRLLRDQSPAAPHC